MDGRGELTHVPAGLGHDHLGGAPLDPWGRLKQLQQRRAGRDETAELRPVDRGIADKGDGHPRLHPARTSHQAHVAAQRTNRSLKHGHAAREWTLVIDPPGSLACGGVYGSMPRLSRMAHSSPATT